MLQQEASLALVQEEEQEEGLEEVEAGVQGLFTSA